MQYPILTSGFEADAPFRPPQNALVSKFWHFKRHVLLGQEPLRCTSADFKDRYPRLPFWIVSQWLQRSLRFSPGLIAICRISLATHWQTIRACSFLTRPKRISIEKILVSHSPPYFRTRLPPHYLSKKSLRETVNELFGSMEVSSVISYSCALSNRYVCSSPRIRSPLYPCFSKLALENLMFVASCSHIWDGYPP